MAGAPERTAVLVIRAWLEEENDEQPFRARITSTPDVPIAPGAARSVAVASERAVLDAVRTWLRAFAAGR